MGPRPVKRQRLTPPPTSEDSENSFLASESDSEESLAAKSKAQAKAFLPSAANWDLEQAYENRSRKKRKHDKEDTRLPIKSVEGGLKPSILAKSEIQSGSDTEEEEGGNSTAFDDDLPVKTPNIPIKEQIIRAKEELAKIASLLNEDPEENAGLFKSLGSIGASSVVMIKKLALVTQLSVFKDLIPGYRIRPIAEADQTIKVSKEVKRLRSFEQALISSYQSYINTLTNLAKGARGAKTAADRASLSSTAVSCACALLLAVPHFNFRSDLVKILINKLSTRAIDGDFQKCINTIEKLFQDDEDGTPSLDSISQLTKMLKTRSYRIDERVLNTFLHLRLLSEFSSKGSRSTIDAPVAPLPKKLKREYRSKRERKQAKERKGIEKEFAEADASVSHEAREKMQAETLKLVFVTYFRVLKARTTGLNGAVLEGLARYAHLINQEFFGDLLEVIKELVLQAEAEGQLLEEGDDHDETEEVAGKSATRESLLCVVTAFALLQGQDAAKAAAILSLDLSFFINHLYRTLHALALNPDIEFSAKSLHLPDPSQQQQQQDTAKPKVNLQTTTVLLLRSLSAILLPPTAPHAVPPVRLAAFTKTLMTSALHLPAKSTTAMMGLIVQVTKTHARKIGALWDTEERRGDGVFDAEGTVDGGNPFAATVWEGELLRLHYCPAVREGVKAIEGYVGRGKI